MNTSTVTPEIATFAQGVRAALADLPAEEVDDLTEGLEADLAESLAEDLRRTLPDPVAYAAELRLAAGLPGRIVPAKRGPLDVLADIRADLSAVVRRHPGLRSTADFLEALRPAWWILRAWLATWLLAAFFGMERGFGFEGAWWMVLLAFAVISIQWGRGRWAFPGLRGLVVIGNVIAVVALLPVVATAHSWDDDGYESGFADGVGAAGTGGYGGEGEGLFFNGLPLENIYVYDAAGNKLSGVQLFDVDGHPLVPYRNAFDTSILQTPAMLETGVEAYNVYPLQVTKVIEDSYGEFVPDPNPDPDKAAAYANGPFLKVPALQAPEKVAQPND